MSTAFAIWAGICVLAAAGLAVASRRIGRPRAAAWMITIAVLLLIEEDPALLAWLATVGPAVDRDAVAGLVHAHTRSHMYGGAAWSAGAMLCSVLVAHLWLARGEARAWLALLVVLVLGGGADLHGLTLYPQGLPFLPTPADGVTGSGWQALLGGIAIWAFALAWSAGPVLGRRGRPA